METAAQKLQKYLKRLFQEFLKTRWVVPVAILLAGLVYIFTVLFLASICLAGVIPPLAMLGIFWYFRIRTIKKLLIYGLIGCLFFSVLSTVYSVDYYDHVQPTVGRSTDNVLTNCTMSPFRGNSSTVFTYYLTVHLPNNHSEAQHVNVTTQSMAFPSYTRANHSMTLVGHDNATNTSYYSFSTTMSSPVNTFFFWAYVNGTWELGTDHEGETETLLWGPIFTDTWSIAALSFPLNILSTFEIIFIIYALFVLMVWWTRRARDMRVKAYEKAVAQREGETKDLGKKEASKVPSLAAATGAAEEGSFVCSECGADVPADATVCPKCGEKFD